MVKGMQVKVHRTFPKTAKRRTGMHPDTKRMLDSIGKTKGKVVSFEFSSRQEAKNRANAMSRARKRGTVSFREARREGKIVYVRCK
jgi:hypothetical protein